MKTYLVCIAEKYTGKPLTKICEIRAGSKYEVVDEMKLRYPDLVRDIEEDRAYVFAPSWQG